MAEGELLSRQNKWNEALNAYQKSLPVFEAGVKNEPENVTLSRAMANLCERIGDVYQAQKRWSEARDYFQRALDVWQSLKQRNVVRGKDAGNLETLPKKIKQSEAALRK